MEMAVTDEGKKLAGAEIKVFKNGSLVETVLTDSKGLADIPCEPNAIYTIEVGGNKGMVKKKIEVNTKDVAPESAKGDVFFPATVELFEKIEGMDISILDKPIGKIRYNSEFGDFDSDADYTKSVQKQLANLEDDFLAKKDAEQKKKAGAMKQYEEAIKIADKAFSSEEWEKAAEQYRIAEKVNPDPLETYPSFQLAELKTKLIKIEADNKRYNDAIGKADAAVASKDYEIAIAEFQRASGYKPKEDYPQDKIKEVQGLLANFAKVEQSYLAAIEKGDNALKINDLNTAKTAFEEATGLKSDETYPKNKLAEINDILAKKEAKKEEYANAIKTADEALGAKDYEAAKAAYQKATTIDPTEQYPKDQIGKVDALLAASIKLEQDYLAAVEKGDNALSSKSFTEAKTAFELASKLKPEEAYPKNKINEIDDFIAKNEAAEKQYQDKIAEADKALAAKDYELAKTAFSEAKTLKPAEAYPQQKLTEIDGILANLAKVEESYKAAIAKGDAAVTSGDFEGAKSAFNEAITLKPDEKYPKDKLAEIETIVLKNQKSEEEYNSAVQDGDDALSDKNYDKAKEFYTAASGIKPEEAYPKDKLAEIEKTIAEAAENEKAYNDALAAADDAMNANDLKTAKTNYKKAGDLKPEETYPKDQIAKIETQQAEQEELEENYTATISEADAALGSKEYEKAKAAYQKASGLKAEEEYPKSKLAEIDGILAELKGKEENYTAAIDKGDAALAAEDYESAKSAYKEAIAIKDEAYPKEKIAEIEANLKEIAEQKAATEKLEADYQSAITKGDQLGAESKFEEAIAAYQKASELKPEEEYPKGKIEELNTAKDNAAKEAELAAKQKEYDENISTADKAFESGDLETARTAFQAASTVLPEEAYPKEKIASIDKTLANAAEQDQKYKDAIGAADKLIGEEKWEEAKVKYTEALSFKPEQEFPKEKINEIDERLAELAAEQEEIRLQNEKDAEIEANYNAAIAEADELFNAEKLEEAKPKYEAALAIKDDQYTKDKIKEIGLKLSSLAEQEAAAEAQAKIDAEYNAIIAEADGLFESEEFENAKAKYTAAIAVKDEQYPKDKIAEADVKIAELAGAEAAEAAAEAQAKIDAEYDGIIAEADGLFESNDFENAKAKYTAAIAVKDEQYPKDKIAEADVKIAELAGAEAAEAAAEAQAKIDAEYDGIIAEADGLFESEEFENAKAKYTAAIAVKDEQYPKDKIAEADVKLAELAGAEAAEAAAAAQAKTDAEYDALIAAADGLFESNDFENAKEKYTAAIAVKDEQYPKDKIAEADVKIAELAGAEAAKAEAEAQAKIDAQYDALIADADASFEQKEFKPAKTSYEAAIALKNEQYPKDQINKIAAALEALANAEAAAAQEAKKTQDYLAALEKGDQSLASNDLENALKAFQNAKTIKPEEAYPSQKITEIDALIAERESANAAKQAELNKQYDSFMQEGQIARDAKDFEKAISNYQQAQNILPGEELPSLKIKEIMDLKKELAAKEEEIRLRKEQAAANENSYQTAIANGDKYFRDKNYNDAENEYRLALGLKADEVYPKEQLDKIKSIQNELKAAEIAAENAKKAANQKEQRYADLIEQGNKNFQAKSYQSSKSNFESALNIKPNEEYPKAQLALLKDLIQQEQLAEEERRKNLDKPIQIQTGPKATITTDAEMEIEKIYKELWAKQNGDKNAKLEEREKELAAVKVENVANEESRRQNAMELIEEISISMKDQFEMSSELNLQNYETIKEQESDLKNANQELVKASERQREEVMLDKNLLAESIGIYNKRRVEEMTEGKKEMVENEYKEVNESLENKTKRQQTHILDTQQEFEELEKRLMKFHQGKSTEFYPENYKQIIEDTDNYNETALEDLKVSEEKRSNYQVEADETAAKIQKFGQDNAESFKDNQLQIEELEVDLKEKAIADSKASEDRRLDYQSDANETSIKIHQFADENAESFKNNQLEIEELEVDLREQATELVNESEKRRKKNEEVEFYLGEKQERQDQSAADYPQGVTEEILENQNNSTTIRRIVVDGTRTDIYEKTLYKWGGIFYTKNGTNITEDIWDKESR